MKLSKDWTYKTKTFKVTLGGWEASGYTSKTQGCVRKLLEKYPYLEHIEAHEFKIEENGVEDYDAEFTIYIDELDEIRAEQPHLFL